MCVMEQSSEHVRACYDAVAQEYAKRFANELSHKPLDRELLSRFASEVRGRGEVYDLGCGPGQTTAFLHSRGVSVRGLDLSGELITEAHRRNPTIEFEQGDMLALPLADASLAGVVAFYSIVHLSSAELRQALAEIYRILRPDGRILLAFHIGEGTKHVDEFLGHTLSLDFRFFEPQQVAAELTRTGFDNVEDHRTRNPIPMWRHSSLEGLICLLVNRKSE